MAAFVIDVTDAPGGIFTLNLTDEVTAAIVTGESVQSATSKFVWDMEMEDSLGCVTPLFYGKVEVFREVTRA